MLDELKKHKDLLEIKVQGRTRELEATLINLQIDVEKSKELEQQLTF